MKNLALNIPHINDATSFYRAANPMAQLRERCKFLSGSMINSWSEATLRMCDGAFFQRPFLQDHKTALDMAKEAGRKVWVDYDDNLFDVPSDNPTHLQYSSSMVQENVKAILKQADIVTVSTNALKELYSEFNSNIKVVPNALDMGLRCMKERAVKPRRKIIAWRGSKTHQRDVFTYAAQIMEASRDKNNKDWAWHFIGDSLWFLTDSMPHHQTFLTKGMSPLEYHAHIANVAPSAMLVPLYESNFNKCKSNIAWLEATFAGAVAIAPNWEEWQHPGVLQYGSAIQFDNALYSVTNGDVDIEATAKISWEYIQDNLTLAKVNEIRLDVLCELFECDRKDLGAE